MKAIQHLQLRSNCLYLGSGEDHAEKLSGGFYDHTFIPEYAGGYSRHKYFAITYIIKGYGIFKDHLSRSFNYREGDLVLRHADTPFYMSKHFRADGWLEFSAALPQSLSDALLAAGVLRKD
ncbi:MAG: AraC family ligand binding domain-containing protein [Victivallis sp.]